MCLYPRLIKNKKYTPTKKNGGVVPPIMDNRVLAVPVGCNKCIECKKQKARQWQVRMNEELRTNTQATFVTLTFSNEEYTKLSKEVTTTGGYEHDNEIATLAVRRFLERWRKKTTKSVKHWLITEIGGERYEKIHLHGIIWSKDEKEIKEKWKYGYIYIGEYVNEETIGYITKYVNKIDQKHKSYNSKILCSPGIGKNYINRADSQNNKYQEGTTKETYTTRTGIKLNLPIYYRNKIYTEEEREKLWLEKLDKEERYICGEKIKIDKDNTGYYKLLKYYREKNTRLGYGDNSKQWQKNEYEEQRRMMMQKKTRGEEVIEIREEEEEKILIKISPEDAF
jgi:hypothetical protein